MITPAAAIDKQYFGTDVGFQELANLLQALAEPAFAIVGAIFRLVLPRSGFAQHVDRFKRFGPSAVQRVIHGLGVHRLNPARGHLLRAGVLSHHPELPDIGQSDGGRGSAQHARKIWPHGYSAKRRSGLFGNSVKRAIEPSVVSGFDARRAGFHEILCVEVRARRIGRSRGVNNRKFILAKEGLQRSETWMESEKTVEIHRTVRPAASWLRNGDGGAHPVIILLAERHHDVEAVGGAPLKQHNKVLFPRCWRRRDGAQEKRGHRAQADHGDAALLQEVSARECHWPFAFATVVAHFPSVNQRAYLKTETVLPILWRIPCLFHLL